MNKYCFSSSDLRLQRVWSWKVHSRRFSHIDTAEYIFIFKGKCEDDRIILKLLLKQTLQLPLILPMYYVAICKDWVVCNKESKSLYIHAYRKTLSHTQRYLLFDSHHTLRGHQNITWQSGKTTGRLQVQGWWRRACEGRMKNHEFHNWAFIKTSEWSDRDPRSVSLRERKNRCKNILIPYRNIVSGKCN